MREVTWLVAEMATYGTKGHSPWKDEQKNQLVIYRHRAKRMLN